VALDTLMGVWGASGNALYCWLVSVSSVTTGGDARTPRKARYPPATSWKSQRTSPAHHGERRNCSILSALP